MLSIRITALLICRNVYLIECSPDVYVGVLADGVNVFANSTFKQVR